MTKAITKTLLPKHELDHNKKARHLIDASGKTLGRLATEIAVKLQGKHKTWYCDMRDCGDYVVVINVENIIVTGNKVAEKMYYTHSGYKGHLTELTYKQMTDKNPSSVLELAVKGMLPKTKARKARLKRLKLFVGTDHVYSHQIEQSKSLVNKKFNELQK